MSFDNVRFPTDINYGSSGGPGFRTEIIETDSGAEERVALWSKPRHRYEANYNIRTYANLATLRTFFMARQGAARSFRFKDWLDFTSAADHRSAPTNADQAIGTGNGTAIDFQLIKTYTSGGNSQVRTITKPVVGTVVVALNAVNQTSGWSVNDTTGMVTFTTPPGAGVAVTAGFEFDVPVRFERDIDDVLSIDVDSFADGGVPSIPLIEVIDEIPAGEPFYYGGAQAISMSAHKTITLADGRVLRITPSTANLKLFLPDTTQLALGGPYFYVFNTTSSALLIRTSADVAVASLVTADGMRTLVLGLNGSAQKTWFLV